MYPRVDFDTVDSFVQFAKMVDVFSLSSKPPACIYAPGLGMAISLFNSGLYYPRYKILGFKVAIEFDSCIFSDYRKSPADGPFIGCNDD